MHRAPTCFGILRHRLGRVDRSLGGLELLTFVDDRLRLVEAAAQLLCARVGLDGRRLDPAERPAPDRLPQSGDRHCDSSQESEAAGHEADATLVAASCPAPRSVAVQTEGRRLGTPVTPYEILLMLDPELPEERQSEIVTRTR